MENPSAKEIWDKASQLIKSEINGISYDSWFKDIVPVSFDGQVLTLLVNIEFIRNMLRNNYDQLIQAALMQAAGEPVNAPREEAPARPSAAASMLNPKYTFSTYVIGKSNNFAHAAAYAVSQSPGDTSSGPEHLFLHPSFVSNLIKFVLYRHELLRIILSSLHR